MVDIVDVSNACSDQILATQMANARAKANERELHPVGSCHYCDCAVIRGSLFCDAICRDDYQAEQDAIARNGG